jgi:UPF0755 protein
MKTFIKILIVMVAIIVTVLLSGNYYVRQQFEKKVTYKDSLIINIPKNTSISGAIQILNKSGQLKPNWLFKLVARYYAEANKKHIYHGPYLFDDGITQYELLKALFNSENLYRIKVAFPPGISYKRFADILEQKLKINKRIFLSLCHSDSLLKSRGIPAKNPEGYLLPDTYIFFANISEREVLDELLDYQEKIWKSKFEGKKQGFTKHQILTMASIVQAECKLKEEKPIVSGLYYNRLNKNMLLQADPTVQFAMGEKRRVLYKDLEIDNPYNTYKYQGLPPSPINCPDISSIDAAVNPVKHDYLYMVAVGDGSGKHNFSKTHNQHIKYVNEFRRNYRNNK